MSKIDYIVAGLFIIVGAWQLFVTVGYLKELKKNGNKKTSPFALMAFWSSLVIGVTLVILGISGLL
ncbi:hypothetical protein [Companilactobacillus halodurans]|uniref:Immunity protein n=1 Tax=Companilactobacillus halodurans TaxID=2584183 RepID=A0A5P0ZV91_9LACO|nr:hypothetical protein [Companilactobacillus halodurans]MQS76424.1 hypothetical protein [Companilactobacillus halodurans]MQS96825.1 hypothetical protein [Companilactobacillus halodurans]